MNNYTLALENDKLYDVIPFVTFLKNNEGTDIEIIVNQESHCLRYTKVYDLLDLFNFKSVTIFTDNAVEKHDCYKIKNNNWSHWLSTMAIKFDQTKDYSWNNEKLFGCFYGRPTASRLGIAGYLNSKYPDKSLLCLNFNYSEENGRKLFDLERLFAWNSNTITQFELLCSQQEKYRSKFQAYNYNTFNYEINHPLNDLYKNIFVDIVVEAHLFGNSFYPTEKIARAIMCKKPFIVVAPLFYLEYLKQMGFKTFNKFWAEDYDYLGANNRYVAILTQLDYLANLTQDQLIELNKQVQPIVEHNYQLLKNMQYNTNIIKKEPHYEE